MRHLSRKEYTISGENGKKRQVIRNGNRSFSTKSDIAGGGGRLMRSRESPLPKGVKNYSRPRNISAFSKQMRETPLLQACYRQRKRETPANTYSQSYPLYPQTVDKVFHNLWINKRSFVDNSGFYRLSELKTEKKGETREKRGKIQRENTVENHVTERLRHRPVNFRLPYYIKRSIMDFG